MLTAAERNELKAGDFALPKERTYPIHTLAHAKDALSRAAQNATPDEHAKVKAAVHKRYPKLAGKSGGMSPNQAPATRPKFTAPDASALGSG